MVNNYNRVVVLLQTKQPEYSSETFPQTKEEKLQPDKIYLYFYKNIPQYDLEFLFPNIKISMNLKDKLLLGIPAVGAAVPMIIKVLPSIALVVGAIALYVFGMDLGGKFKVDAHDARALYPLLAAVLSVGVALDGFSASQYIKYKSKRLEFLKKVTDVLFFKSLDVSEGVLHSLIVCGKFFSGEFSYSTAQRNSSNVRYPLCTDRLNHCKT